jgi:beta-glucanase (GH16 family)
MRFLILVGLSGSLVLWPGARATTQGGREVLFYDDFAGPALDRSRWNVVVTGRTVNNEQQAYVDSDETIALLPGPAEGATNGALALRPRWRPGHRTAEGRRFDFVSGRLDTRGRFGFTYGRASARMKLAAADGLWPAFWLLGAGPWPATGEIDIMEHVGVAGWTSVALHGPGYSGDTPLVHRAPAGDGGIADWHVYSVDWSEQAIVFFVDGREVYRVTRAMVESHGRWAFDNEKFVIVNLALGGSYPQSVNKAGDPYPGLPAATVERIQSGRVQVLVDWIRVERN